MTLLTTVGTFNNPTPSPLSADKSLHPHFNLSPDLKT